MTDIERQFIQLIRFAISNDSLPDIVDWTGVWNLAKRHHLEVLLAESLKNYTCIPDDFSCDMTDYCNRMIARDIRLFHCLEMIKSVLDSNST